MIDRFKSKLAKWKAKVLSFGDRLTLIKALLGSILLYLLSMFKAPTKVIQILEGIRRDFLWGGSDNNTDISWVKWDHVIAPLELGGLGVGSIKDANLALLNKWEWKFKRDRGELWARVMLSIHSMPRRYMSYPVRANVAAGWKMIVQ